MDEPVLYRETFTITGGDFEHGGDAAAAVKTAMKDLGLDPAIIRRLSIANFEAEMNVIMYADEGRMDLVITPSAIRVVVADRGPGIEDIELAMQEGYSTATAEMRARGFGAGMGLPNIKRSTDSFEIDSVPGQGTTLRYAVQLPRGGGQGERERNRD
jgi:anti-sigma regulatory factor (Ser/Thr protein kinase)